MNEGCSKTPVVVGVAVALVRAWPWVAPTPTPQRQRPEGVISVPLLTLSGAACKPLHVYKSLELQVTHRHTHSRVTLPALRPPGPAPRARRRRACPRRARRGHQRASNPCCFADLHLGCTVQTVQWARRDTRAGRRRCSGDARWARLQAEAQRSAGASEVRLATGTVKTTYIAAALFDPCELTRERDERCRKALM